jgi:hypothetical protein
MITVVLILAALVVLIATDSGGAAGEAPPDDGNSATDGRSWLKRLFGSRSHEPSSRKPEDHSRGGK